MTIKSKSRQVGRMIRQMTGLCLPVAQKLGKAIVQEKTTSDILTKFPMVKKRESGCDCCGTDIFTIEGPKGALQTEGLYLRVEYIEKEFLHFTAQKNMPPGKSGWAIGPNREITYW